MAEMSLRQLREAKGLTQDQLASRSGITAATIAKLEANAIRPQPVVLQRLAAALDLDSKELARHLSESRRRRTHQRALIPGLGPWG